jgi:glycosyltransferase involved in cell wall biosynthesis
LTIKAEPHPEKTLSVPLSIRDGDPNQIIVLGAIGPHKGSRRLLELAREACLAEPLLKFHVIGYTDIDKELRALGNVKITGRYKQEELNSLVERTGGRYAIFPYLWPETFSYTLSEALRLMIWPIVPRLGAPAERVEQLQFGSILESMTLEALTEELRRLQCKADRDSSMTRVQSATVSNYAL